MKRLNLLKKQMIIFWLFCFQEQLLSKVANVPFEELKDFCNNFVSHFFKPGGLNLFRSCLNRESRSQHWQKVSLNSQENLDTF